MSSYKTLHEEFVSNLNGTTIEESQLAASCAPLSVLFHHLVTSLFFIPRKNLLSFIVDFIFCILPCSLTVTVLADNIPALLTFLLIGSISIFIFNSQCQQFRMHQKEKKQRRTGKKEELGSVTRSYWKDCFEILTVDMKDVRPFISNFRAFVNIVTAVCILGVDFQVFPRRFGKCETYGTGLMDTGVGSFVICNAIVSSEVRNSSKKSSLSKTIVSTAPLWILGLIRLISIRNLDYQEHASEYGVHWNFFFTLAMVKIVSAIVLTVVSSRLCLFLSVCIISGYQYLLTSAGLMDFIIYGVKGDGSRNGLIDANREGICSVMGYLALYFIGVEIGKQLFSKRNYLSLYCVLFALSSVSCMLLYVCQIFVEPVSRRTANLGYFLWMIFFNCLLLTSFLLMEIIMLCNHRFFDTHETKPSSSDHTVHLISQLVNAVNHHGLVYFLLANLLTGMVNMNVETIFATHIEGFIIITLYMFILSAVIYTFSRFGIRTKIW